MAGIFGGFTPDNTLGALFLTPPKGNEAHWRRKLANQGSISKPKPSVGQWLEHATVNTLRKAGVSDKRAARLGSKTFAAVNDLTPVGNLTGADDGATMLGRGLTRGDLGQAALGAGVFGLSVLPVPQGAKRVVSNGARGMFGRLLKDESGAIRAWHGSPHDFDRFEWSPRTRGTGEGAQVYGDGLYFAENPAVAQAYQNNLAGIEFPAQDSNLKRMLEESFKQLTNTRMGPVTARDATDIVGEKLARQRADALRSGDFDWFNQIEDQRRELDRIAKEPPKPNGRLYEVNIDANPEDFLNWDADVTGRVADAIRGLGIEPAVANRWYPMPRYEPNETRRWHNNGAEVAETANGFIAGLNGKVFGTYPTLEEAQAAVPIIQQPLLGEQVHSKLAEKLTKSGASDALWKQGIPGISFWDQGSRLSGTGTRNYVVFDDSIIDILNKY